jgi:hypothetical protein
MAAGLLVALLAALAAVHAEDPVDWHTPNILLENGRQCAPARRRSRSAAVRALWRAARRLA